MAEKGVEHRVEACHSEDFLARGSGAVTQSGILQRCFDSRFDPVRETLVEDVAHNMGQPCVSEATRVVRLVSHDRRNDERHTGLQSAKHGARPAMA